jgi:uncharacterized protein
MKKTSLRKATSAKLAKLQKILKSMNRVLIAFSGGVDSTLLVKTAADVLGKNVLAVIASSETYPAQEIRQAKKIAERLGVLHKTIHTHEIKNPDFVKNPPLRCYHCKQELFSRLKSLAAKAGIPYVLDGQNADDVGDFRPGSKAGQELGVRSPLKEAGLTKAEIRRISRSFGLPTWNKPSLACLASRFPYYTKITIDDLKKVGKAENLLEDMGFGQLRVRHHGQIARIEIPLQDFPKILKPRLRRQIVDAFKKIGYPYVALDLAGYRSGSLNEPLNPQQLRFRSNSG